MKNKLLVLFSMSTGQPQAGIRRTLFTHVCWEHQGSLVDFRQGANEIEFANGFKWAAVLRSRSGNAILLEYSAGV